MMEGLDESDTSGPASFQQSSINCELYEITVDDRRNYDNKCHCGPRYCTDKLPRRIAHAIEPPDSWSQTHSSAAAVLPIFLIFSTLN